MKDEATQDLRSHRYRVSIKGIPTVDYKKNRESFGETLDERWDPVRSLSDNITINIDFGTNFLNFIGKLG